ncbi:MAG: hypothetical protein QOD61_744 [Solirubrobacteraceae bacterium]|jgi:hypothetical protein|nr:hypothetical protein [Solirubrobacteraceae bacterium]
MARTGVDADQRLGELILYVAWKSAGDRRFGDVKLNKLLFFSDFVAYAALGEPITGSVYQKLRHGPCPRRMVPVRNQLVRRGDVELIVEGVGFPRHRTVAKKSANLDLFTAPQIALVDEVIEHFWHFNASQIEAAAHRASVGWQIAEMKEDIPYETALMTTRPISAEVRDLARRRFAEMA